MLVSGSASVFYWAIPLMPFSTRAESDVLKVYLWSLPCWSAIFAALPFVVVFIDWPRRATRDWPHWLGVLLWTLGSLVAFGKRDAGSVAVRNSLRVE